MSSTPTPTDQKVTLHQISWETYQRLLAEHTDASSPRFTYDRGVLEIIKPSAEHERYNVRISELVGTLAVRMEIGLEALGSTTFTRQDIERGFEPDACFYAQNAEKVRNKARLDMAIDPPPDLGVEIDITHSSINKLALYREFGVPEIWRYNGSRLEILLLGENGYETAHVSGTLPGVPATELTQLLEEGKSHLLGGWSKLVRSWAHERFGNS